LKDAQRFGPWLRTIVVRKATKSKAKSIKPRRPPELQPAGPGDDLEQRELAALIHEAVGTLDETYREALSLFYSRVTASKKPPAFWTFRPARSSARLHEGRQRLREVAEHILSGMRPVNAKARADSPQLRDAAAGGIQSERFYRAMRQVLRLCPVRTSYSRNS